MAAEENAIDVEWGTSAARDVLYDMIMDGKIENEMKPKQVYLTYLKHLPEFQPFQDYTALKFASKLSGARKRATKKLDRAAEDQAFFEHDRAIFPAPVVDTKNQPMWKGSEAQTLLRKALADIKSGKKEYQKPRFLFLEHEEWYENYSLEFFRKKIYQEIKADKRAAWLEEKYGTPSEQLGEDDEDDENWWRHPLE